MNSSVSGHEGDNISVQCFYSSGYQNKSKQWCRYKDKDCYTLGRTDTSQHSSVQISDDGRSSFTVLMTGLRLSDSGWYFCSAGDLQAIVQLTVTAESNTSSVEAGPSSNSKIARNDPEDAWSDHRNRIFLLLWTAVPLLTLVLLIWRIIQKHNLPTQGRDVCSETEGLVMYVVVFKKGKNNEQNQVSIIRPPDQEEVIYSAVKLH
ncbi:CMRF35-like molecule 7 [Siphateles boraxobius]|uniref:CMRF35-like molecule 7 n=1 Tax=Siphateles boraxobius TaxID=180520 RepID=UPI004062F564